MNSSIKIFSLILFQILIVACDSGPSENEQTAATDKSIVAVIAPDFNSESAFEKIEKQLAFGYRVPNSPAHKACGDWIVASLKEFGLKVTEQHFDAFSYKGKKLNARNIIATYNPEASKRILLAAHWDTREIADQDTERKDQPIAGANDAASGVAILLQLAEEISKAGTKPNIGIDYIFFDAEDGGKPESFTGNALNDYGGYLMGSEYWSKNPHIENYSAFYGILFDMVGAKGATFLKEDASMQIAPSVVNKIWGVAASKGFDTYFINQKGAGITDDHLPVIINRKIPMIDIIDQKISGNQTFFDHWHTHQDTIESIDKNTLEAVGETIIQTLYQENGTL
jgi:glutaminyl-peptide cyclotransferase